jgi:hypothetical protein
MVERVPAAVLIVPFACFLYIASMDILDLVEDRHFGDILLLLYCVLTCASWIAFLDKVLLADKPRNVPVQWNQRRPLPQA